MATAPDVQDTQHIPLDSLNRLEMLWRYRERQGMALAVGVAVACWQVIHLITTGAGDGDFITTFVRIAPMVGPVLMIAGIWFWMLADRKRLRIDLLLDESARLARRPRSLRDSTAE